MISAMITECLIFCNLKILNQIVKIFQWNHRILCWFMLANHLVCLGPSPFYNQLYNCLQPINNWWTETFSRLAFFSPDNLLDSDLCNDTLRKDLLLYLFHSNFKNCSALITFVQISVAQLNNIWINRSNFIWNRKYNINKICYCSTTLKWLYS